MAETNLFSFLFGNNDNNPTVTYIPKEQSPEPKIHGGSAPIQENMNIMAGYPRTPGHAVSARERRWFRYALQLWNEWGHTLDDHERLTWKKELPFLRSNKNKRTWGEHRFCSPAVMTWTHWTFLRIMFPLDWILGSRVALRVQVKYPQADIAQWAPNSNGPTRDQRFRASRHLRSVPGEACKPMREGHGEFTKVQIKAEASRGIQTDPASSITGSEDIEYSSSEGTDTRLQAPTITAQRPVEDEARPCGEDPSSTFQSRTESAGQAPPEFSKSQKGEMEVEDKKIAKLEYLASDMRRNEMLQMRQEISKLRYDLEKANERIVHLEAARERQDQERAALREAFV